MPDCLIDANVWLASLFPNHSAHQAARAALGEIRAQSRALFCRMTQLSVLRLCTTRALLRAYGVDEMSNRDALQAWNVLASLSNVAEVAEPAGTVELWHELAGRATASPKLWMDAYLAAFAICGGFGFLTLDDAFHQFRRRGLKLRLLRVR